MATNYGLFRLLSVLLVGVIISSEGGGKPDVCQQRVQPGLCMGYFPRWYFNSTLNKCKEFIFGGCQKNGNNFMTMKECEERCLHANDKELQSSHGQEEEEERSSYTHSVDKELNSSAEEQEHQGGRCLHKIKKMAHKADLLKSILSQGVPMFQPKYMPQCDEKGNYAPMQCMMDNSKCWCVDRLRGKKIKNSREKRTRGKPEELDCS